MVKFITYLCLTAVAVGLGILVMMYGWGLHPRSWAWIVGGGVFANAVLRSVFDAVEKELKNK
jgi:hypothetical protein